MYKKFHKSLFLIKLLGICLILLLIQRVFFLTMFYQQFQDVFFFEFVKAFFIGALTDAVVSIIFLLPVWIILLFFNIENKISQYFALTFLLIGFAITSILNLIS